MKKAKQVLALLLASTLWAGTIQMPVIAAEVFESESEESVAEEVSDTDPSASEGLDSDESPDSDWAVQEDQEEQGVEEDREGQADPIMTDSGDEDEPDDPIIDMEETQDSGQDGGLPENSSEQTIPDSQTEEMQPKEDAGPQDIENQSDGGSESNAEEVGSEETVMPEGAIIEESDHAEVQMAASRGSIDGNSKITWTGNTMPAANDITSVSLRRRAYLTAVQGGYMRVEYDGKDIVVEYFDESFHMTRQGHLSMELDVWGGFYAGADAYYVAEGQYNKDCTDGTEVLRIIKYDFDWNRLGAGNILAQDGWEYEIRYPFDYSCVSMDEVDGKLYLSTGREGYVDEAVGQGHQGMMLIRMDEQTFDTEIVYGDFWHSFSQYLGHSGTDLFICEQSEGGRCTMLSRFDTNRTGTDYFNAFSERFSVLDYGGNRTSAWAIPCYASVDGLAISSDHVLCLGTSIDQSQYDSVTSDTPHNIYLTVTPLSDPDAEHSSVRWLTAYSGGGKSFLGVNITKINDNRFMVAWEEKPEDEESISPADEGDPLSTGVLHYLFVDGSGNTVSKEFTARAMVSDCRPVLAGDRIVYYASKANCLDFYSIDAFSGKFSKNVTRIAGAQITWDYDAGILSFSGKGALSIDLEAHYRHALSDTDSWSVYSDADNCWSFIRDHVTGISIGKGITSIPERAFAWFNHLTDVKLPDGLKTIGKEAFYACGELRKLSVPDSVNRIGEDILWTGSYWISDNSHVIYAVIYGSCTSTAIKYAKKNNISYEEKHKWAAELVTTKATTKKNGKTAKKCSLCGKTVTKKVIYYPKTITLSKTIFTYNGKVQKPKVTVKGSDGKTIAAGSYTLKYSAGRKTPGIYSVKIVFKGNYTGTVRKTFKIIPKGTAISKLTKGSRQFTVKWKKQAVQTTGYQIQYSTGKAFKSGNRTVTVKKASAVSKRIGGLKKGKTYYVRIRTYKTVGGKNYYSSWSAAKSVKIDK